MATYGRRSLRDRFDLASTPHIAHPPRTHHRDFYVATDGSFRRATGEAGLGVVIETRDGARVARRALSTVAPDNNVAEYQALDLGLDLLAAHAPPSARVGVLLDHDQLASNVNLATLTRRQPDWESLSELCVPPASQSHWRSIRARLDSFGELRAAVLDGGENPAHPLANTPERYDHVNREPVRPTSAPSVQVPPPSRADRHATGQADD
ncbi:reverse transcriptase-like protein [Natronorarus salvus]|uniref:reverse transcriptase-like protein n=1 Tax=Natronorarus salvus TaxID=3117733 RepID=UPI002F2617D7